MEVWDRAIRCTHLGTWSLLTHYADVLQQLVIQLCLSLIKTCLLLLILDLKLIRVLLSCGGVSTSNVDVVSEVFNNHWLRWLVEVWHDLRLLDFILLVIIFEISAHLHDSVWKCTLSRDEISHIVHENVRSRVSNCWATVEVLRLKFSKVDLYIFISACLVKMACIWMN